MSDDTVPSRNTLKQQRRRAGMRAMYDAVEASGGEVLTQAAPVLKTPGGHVIVQVHGEWFFVGDRWVPPPS